MIQILSKSLTETHTVIKSEPITTRDRSTTHFYTYLQRLAVLG